MYFRALFLHHRGFIIGACAIQKTHFGVKYPPTDGSAFLFIIEWSVSRLTVSSCLFLKRNKKKCLFLLVVLKSLFKSLITSGRVLSPSDPCPVMSWTWQILLRPQHLLTRTPWPISRIISSSEVSVLRWKDGQCEKQNNFGEKCGNEKLQVFIYKKKKKVWINYCYFD